MQCSCGSSSFASSTLAHTFDTRACEYSFNACKSCGRQGGHVISDLQTGKVLVTGMAAIRAIQADELRILDIDPSGSKAQFRSLPVPEEKVPEEKITPVSQESAEAPSVFTLNNVTGPMKKPLTAAEKGKALHERGRHYFFWNSESHNVRVKYHHHLYDNGAEEVHFPAFGLIDYRKSGESERSPLMGALTLIKTVLERHFDEPTLSTSVTCAPPQGGWLEACKDGEWVSMLEAEPSVENSEPVVEVEPEKHLATQDSQESVTDANTQALAMDEMEEPEDIAVLEDACDPLAVSHHKDSKETMQMSLF